MSTLDPKEQNAISHLLAAEVDFLTAFGWVPIVVKMRGGGSIVQYISPIKKDQMDLWAAVARQKTTIDYDMRRTRE